LFAVPVVMLLNTKLEAVTGGMVLAVELETVEADMLRVNRVLKI
jgi:hypothetical protein